MENFSRDIDSRNLNVLFVCSRNNWRSPTAEAIFKDRQNLNVKSAGTEPSARVRVSENLLLWADLIFVMEKRHKQRLSEKFPDVTPSKTIYILGIEDEYEYMDPELVDSITKAVAPYLDND